MRLLWLLATFVVVASAGTIKAPPSSEGKVRYDGFRVYKLHIRNKAQLSIITHLQELTQKYNIWKEYDEYSKEVHIMVNPSEFGKFTRLLYIHNLKHEVAIENVQRLIDEEQTVASDTESFGWTRYYDLPEIEAWLDEILRTYPTVTESFVIGKSYENRNIRGIKISHKAGNPGIFIESNIHAREWITSASATWLINQLLTSDKAEVRNLADNYDWYIVPVFNVDGFAYSHNRDRMWRKTRQPHATSSCIGVDANRNFDSYWLVNNGASDNPCSESFAGPRPWSEPETKALSDYVRSIKDKLKLYISFHSYGQWLLTPYGHTDVEFPVNYADLEIVGEAFTSAVEGLTYGTKYVHGSTGSVLYIASGTSVDWMFNELKFGLGYTIEFRDKGRWGFVLPPVQILPNCEELLTGLTALVAKAKELQYV